MSDITFNGLTSTLKGNLYTTPAIKKLAYIFPKSKGAVGSVPSEWISNVPQEIRKNFIKNLYGVFSNIIEIQRTKIFANGKSSKILKNFLIENGVIKETERLRFRYIGSGAFATVMRFNVGKNQYALKIFNKDYNFGDIQIFKEFGNGAEQNNALYLNADEKSDWTKFYFGNVLDRYMVTRYVSDNDPLPRKKIKLFKKGLEYIDYDTKNVKNNTGIDYGGFRKLKGFPVGNKVAMWIIGRLMEMPADKRNEEILKIETNKSIPNYYDRIVGVNYVKTHIMPKEKELEMQKHGFWYSLIRAFMGQYKD